MGELARVAVAVLVLACGGKEPAAPARGAPAPGPTGVTEVPVPTPAATPTPARKPRELVLTRAELQALLDAWVAAQNAGDFAAYEALYAVEMRGVKRIGERESSFDRVGWMKDRARMFKKPLEVSVSDVRFSGQSGSARIDFVQTFHSGTFTDSGPKRLTVVERGGAARILREEMLVSNLVASKSALADRVYLMFSKRSAYVVLDETAETSWGVGQFAVDTEGSPTVYSQDVDATKVPGGERWLGTSFRVHDLKGGSCKSGLDRLELLIVAEEHGWMLEDIQERVSQLPLVERDDAEARHLMKQQPAMLVGRLSQCTGAYATPADQPEPSVFVPRGASAELTEQVRTATRALPKYKTLQSEWEAMWKQDAEGAQLAPNEQAGPWGGEGTVQVFVSPQGTRFATAWFSSSGCGLELSADLLALYRLDDSGLSLVSTSSSGGYPSLLVDVNLDGTPEIFSDVVYGSLYAVGASGVSLLKSVPSLYGGCGC